MRRDGAFLPWAESHLRPLYYQSLDRLGYSDFSDFRQAAMEKLLMVAEAKPARFFRDDFTDANLARLLRRLACTRRVDLYRRLSKRKSRHMDFQTLEIGEEAETPVPESFLSEQDHEALLNWPQCLPEFQQAREVVRGYAKTIRMRPGVRQALAVFLSYFRKMARIRQCACHWLTMRALLIDGVHTPENILETLRECAPKIKPGTLSKRIKTLKETFRDYLDERELRGWATVDTVLLVCG